MINMFKKIFMVFIILILGSALISCNQNNSNSNDNTPTIAQQSKDLVTKNNYKTNNEIKVGENSNIITKQGIFENKVFWRDNTWNLGVDNNGDFITFNLKSNDIERIDSNNNISTVLNIMQKRKNHIYTIKKFGDIVAWSECPHGDMDPAEDMTKGADWCVYFADLKTKKIKKVDEYKKISIPENAQYGYLAPNQVFISQDNITYICFDFAPDGNVTSVIKLYTISTGNLEIIDYLNEDLTKYAYGYPNISGDKMVWCKALVNPDGTYTGQSYLYDLKTKVKSKMITSENNINPRINDDYIFAQGTPNITFYDSEVCVYDIKKNQWVYKINNGYSQYNMQKDVYLTNINTDGNYAIWDTGVMRALVIFNKRDNKLYNIIEFSDNKQITSPMLLDGGLLIWFEKPWGSQGIMKPIFKYCYLK